MRFHRLAPALVVAVPLFIACSDPVPPTPRGAWQVSFTDPGAACQHSGHNTVVGEVDADSKSTLLNNGADGADIECSVIGTSTFEVDASATQAGKTLKIVIPQIASSATDLAPAKGTLAFRSATTQDTYTSKPSTCDFWFIAGSGQGVGAGKVWVSFKCDEVSSEGSTCEIQQGFAIFENCATSATVEEE